MKKHLKEMTLVAMFPAFMIATAGFYIPLGSLPSITFQTFFVFLSGLFLGSKKGGLSMLIYVFLGAVGLPAFSGFQSGLGILFGPTGGFIFSFIIVAFLVGAIKEKLPPTSQKFVVYLMILVLGNCIIYFIGSIYFAFVMKTSLYIVLSGFLIYIPGDIFKIIVSVLVYFRLRVILNQ